MDNLQMQKLIIVLNLKEQFNDKCVCFQTLRDQSKSNILIINDILTTASKLTSCI